MADTKRVGLGLLDGLLELGKIGVSYRAQRQIEAPKSGLKRRKPKNAAEGCTPCAAKARGADMANTIWK